MTWTPSVKMGAQDRRSSVFDYWSPTAAWFGLSLHLSGSSWNPLFFGSGRSCYLWLISPYNALAYFLRVNMFWRGNYKHNHPSLTGGWMSAGRVSLWPPPSTLASFPVWSAFNPELFYKPAFRMLYWYKRMDKYSQEKDHVNVELQIILRN